jgi:hypothetical protein
LTFKIALSVILVTVVAAATAAYLVWRGVDLDVRRKHHEVGNAIYLQMGVVFAVLLAFVFNEIWSEYNVAAQAINGESGALRGAAMLAHNLPDRQGRDVERAILNYAKVVTNFEWRAMANREESPEAMGAFEAIVEAAERLNVAAPADTAIQGQILSLLAQAHTYRETRMYQANRGLPIVIWLILSFYAVALVLFVLFAGVQSGVAHMTFASVFAISVVLALIVVRMLDYPFEGALALRNRDFVKTIERVTAMMDRRTIREDGGEASQTGTSPAVQR